MLNTKVRLSYKRNECAFCLTSFGVVKLNVLRSNMTTVTVISVPFAVKSLKKCDSSYLTAAT